MAKVAFLLASGFEDSEMKNPYDAVKEATCFIGIRDDVKLAGAVYHDKEVVVSENLVTSRTLADEPAFIREILAKLS